MFREALRLSTELGDPSNTAQLRIFLGEVHNVQRRFVEAETELRAALARSDALGETALLVAQRELGLALSEQGRFAEAEQLLLDTLARSEASSGADSINAIGFLAALGAHYRRAGTPAESLDYTTRANALAHRDDAQELWTSTAGMAEHARTLAALGRTGEATPLCQEAASLLAVVFGGSDPRVVELQAEAAAAAP
jgi:tetratricopeptide (TPR) repeat protein